MLRQKNLECTTKQRRNWTLNNKLTLENTEDPWQPWTAGWNNPSFKCRQKFYTNSSTDKTV